MSERLDLSGSDSLQTGDISDILAFKRGLIVPPDVAEAFQSAICTNWDGEVDKGWVVSKDGRRLGFAPRLLILHDDSDEINRSYGRWTPYDVKSSADLGSENRWRSEGFAGYLSRDDEEDKKLIDRDPSVANWQWGSALFVSKNSIDFKIYHSGMADGPMGNPKAGEELEREGRILKWEKNIRDLSIKIRYSAELNGKLVNVRVDPEAWIQPDEHIFSEAPLELIFNEEGTQVLRFKRGQWGNPEYTGEKELVLGKRLQFFRLGRLVDVEDGLAAVTIYFSRNDDYEVNDFFVRIPKWQPVEDILDHRAEEVRRFGVETDLIPEILRRRPMLRDCEPDSLWLWGNMTKALKITVDKNISSE